MDWYLQELYVRYLQQELEVQVATRPPSGRRPGGVVRRRLAWSFVRLGLRLDAEASVAALKLSYGP